MAKNMADNIILEEMDAAVAAYLTGDDVYNEIIPIMNSLNNKTSHIHIEPFNGYYSGDGFYLSHDKNNQVYLECIISMDHSINFILRIKEKKSKYSHDCLNDVTVYEETVPYSSVMTLESKCLELTKKMIKLEQKSTFRVPVSVFEGLDELTKQKLLKYKED